MEEVEEEAFLRSSNLKEERRRMFLFARCKLGNAEIGKPRSRALLPLVSRINCEKVTKIKVFCVYYLASNLSHISANADT